MVDHPASASPPQPIPGELKKTLGEAKELRRQGRVLEALKKVEGVTEAYPDQPGAWAQTAAVYLDLKMRERATAMLARAVTIDPMSTPVAQQLAKVILKREGMHLRDSIGEMMLFLRELGFRPGTIIDVGVNTGTPGLYEFFADAHILMVDPLEESVQFMRHAQSMFPNAVYECCAAGAAEGEFTLSIHPSFGGSRLVEVVGRHAKGTDRTVPVHRIDALVHKHRLPGPYVLKVDVEGGEVDVLDSSTDILSQTEVLILETRVRPVANAPDLLSVTDYLRDKGFVPYDFIDRNYHDGDGTLKQFDLVAVRREGFFRNAVAYTELKQTDPGKLQAITEAKLRKRETATAKLQAADESGGSRRSDG